jgi:hypothetical protein
MKKMTGWMKKERRQKQIDRRCEKRSVLVTETSGAVGAVLWVQEKRMKKRNLRLTKNSAEWPTVLVAAAPIAETEEETSFDSLKPVVVVSVFPLPLLVVVNHARL